MLLKKPGPQNVGIVSVMKNIQCFSQLADHAYKIQHRKAVSLEIADDHFDLPAGAYVGISISMHTCNPY